MKAILFHEHGGPEVLQYTDFPTPEPKVGEVLIRIRAAVRNILFPHQKPLFRFL